MTQHFEDEQSSQADPGGRLGVGGEKGVNIPRRAACGGENNWGSGRQTWRWETSMRGYGRMQGWRLGRIPGSHLIGPWLDTTKYKEVIHCFIVQHGQRLETISMFHQRDWLKNWWSTKPRIAKREVDWILYGWICCDLSTTDWSARCKTMSIVYVLKKKK